MQLHHRRRSRLLVLLAALALSLVATACPAAPPLVVTVPGFSTQAPTLSFSAPGVDVSFLGCGGRFNPPAGSLSGPAVTVPDFQYTVGSSNVTIPGIKIAATSANVSLGSFTLSCSLPWPLPPITASTGVSGTISTQATDVTGTVDLTARTITLSGITLTASGRVNFANFGGLDLPLAGFQIPLPTVTIPF
mgnify:CR=1 FL=1